MRNRVNTTVAIVGGLAFYWLLLRGTYFEQVLEKGSDETVLFGAPYFIVFVVLSIAVFFVFFFAHMRCERLLSRFYTPAQVVVFLCLITNFVCLVIANHIDDPGVGLGITAAAAAVVGLSILLYFWTALLAKQEVRTVLGYAFSALLVSFLIEIGFNLFPDTYDLEQRAFCGLMSLCLYWLYPSSERRISILTPWWPQAQSDMETHIPRRPSPNTLTSRFCAGQAVEQGLHIDAWYPVSVGRVIRAFDSDVHTWKRVVLMMTLLLIVATAIRGLVVELYVNPDATDPRAMFYLANLIIVSAVLVCCSRNQEPLKQLCILWIFAVALLLISFIAILITSVSTLYFVTLFSLALRVSLNILYFASLVMLARHGAISKMAAFLCFYGIQVFSIAQGYLFSPLLLTAYPTVFSFAVGIAAVALVLWAAHSFRQMAKLVVAVKIKQLSFQFAQNQSCGSGTDSSLPKPVDEITEDGICQNLSKRFFLSPREEDVCRLLLRGFTRKAIGQELNIKLFTADGYIKDLYRKTGCHKKDDLIRLVNEEREVLLEEKSRKS